MIESVAINLIAPIIVGTILFLLGRYYNRSDEKVKKLTADLESCRKLLKEEKEGRLSDKAKHDSEMLEATVLIEMARKYIRGESIEDVIDMWKGK